MARSPLRLTLKTSERLFLEGLERPTTWTLHPTHHSHVITREGPVTHAPHGLNRVKLLTQLSNCGTYVRYMLVGL